MRAKIIQLSERRPKAQHPGLVLQRFVTKPVTGNNREPEERSDLLRCAIGAARDDMLRELYCAGFKRWNESFPDDGLNPFVELHTDGRIIVGLGADNVLETGLRLHHTYGLPIIPGSALKGLASHYCDEVCGRDDATFCRPSPNDDEQYRKWLAGDSGSRPAENHHRLLFGNTDDGGVIAFHDAWVTPESLPTGVLALDVMTPHHPEWQTGAVPPTDFDSPVPVPYISVAGAFQVRLSWAGPRATPIETAGAWTALAMTLLQRALAEWGVGGKTSSGYGRLVPANQIQNAAFTPICGDEQSKAPRHNRGDHLTVARIEDSKGKQKFEADDGFVGHFAGEEPPEVKIGEQAEVWVANVSPLGYTFTKTEPKQKQKKPPGKGRRR